MNIGRLASVISDTQPIKQVMYLGPTTKTNKMKDKGNISS